MRRSTNITHVGRVAALVFVTACAGMPAAAGADVAGTNDTAALAATNNVAHQGATNAVSKWLDDFTDRAEALSTRYEWARVRVLGLRVWQLVWSVGVVFITILLAHGVGHVLHTRLARALLRRNVPNGDRLVVAVQQPLQGLIYLAGCMIAGAILSLESRHAWAVAVKFGTVALAVICIWLIDRVIDVVANMWLVKARTTAATIDEHLIVMGRKTAKVVALLLIALLMLNALDVNITALLTGLGIGGLAVALALQDTLANFFSSVYIMMDRPFKVGDRIVMDNVDGFVEEIGFRSTRIRTLDKTQVTVPNKTLANANVDNITRTHKRRVTQTMGVTYETTAEQMEQVLEALRAVLQDDAGVDKEFIVVRFYDFGESSLNIQVIYFTSTADYLEYLAIRERINLRFMRALATLGVSIAFPTRTVHLEGEVARQIAQK